MKKSFIAVGVASLLGLASVAQAADFNWYGSIRAGVVKGGSGALNVGATGSDGAGAVGTRIGVKATTELGNGQSAGGQVEIGVAGAAKPVNIRNHNLWIGGGWGKLKLGQQFNPYHVAANWDQFVTLGGARTGKWDGRIEGISYASNLEGPFSFGLMVTGDGAAPKGIDSLYAMAHYNFGVATVNFGYKKENGTDTASYNSSVISVNGSVDNFSYNVAYEQSKSNSMLPNESITGLFMSYGITPRDTVRFGYTPRKVAGVEVKTTQIGFSHSLGSGLAFFAEHSIESKGLNLFLKYDF